MGTSARAESIAPGLVQTYVCPLCSVCISSSSFYFLSFLSHPHTHKWCSIETTWSPPPQSIKTRTPGCYTGTLSQQVSIHFPGARLGTHRNIDSASDVVFAPKFQPETHQICTCQWDLMLLPFLPSQPSPGSYLTPTCRIATGILKVTTARPR